MILVDHLGGNGLHFSYEGVINGRLIKSYVRGKVNGEVYLCLNRLINQILEVIGRPAGTWSKTCYPDKSYGDVVVIEVTNAAVSPA